MTVSRSEIEQRKANMAKAVRAAVRLKYSIMADNEINDLLPALEQEFELAAAKGDCFVLDVGSLLNRAVPDAD